MILEAIESSFGHKETVNTANLQIEHVMPQSLPKTKVGVGWYEMLGSEAGRVHKHWLHTLGNLTLTGYNPKLSNRPFAEKREELLKSKLTVNEYFGSISDWNEGQIRSRGEQLALIVAARWQRPKTDIEYRPLTVARDDVAKAGADRRGEYWARFSKMSENRDCPYRPLRVSNGTYLELFLPLADVALYIQHLRPKKAIIVQFCFSRKRGQQIFDLLAADRLTIDRLFDTPLTWESGEYPTITSRINNVSIVDKLDWLEQHEWMIKTLNSMHRAFNDRLLSLDAVVKEKTEAKQLLLDYWVSFHTFLYRQHSELLHTTALPQVWNDFAIGRSGVWLNALANPTSKRISASLLLGTKVSRVFYPQLEAEKATIESEFGESLEWMNSPTHKQWRMTVSKDDQDINERSYWNDQHVWMYDKLQKFHTVFGERVSRLKFNSAD